jgi:peptidoglycan hydrolase-like protein with peptidoglycan-binding domain
MKPVVWNGSTWSNANEGDGFRGATDPFPFLPSVLIPTSIKRGMSGCFVELVQRYLNKFGEKLVVDGIFGKKTEQAVIKFQVQHGLVSDGKCGNLTLNKILSLL